MVRLSLIAGPALAGASHAAPLSGLAPSLASRLDANKSIDAFINSLNLQKEQVQVVHNYLVKDDNLDAYLRNRSYDKTQLTATACETLEILLGKDSVDTPPVDESSVQESWSQTAWLRTNCMAFPDAKEDVSLAIKTVQFFSTRFSVRSGGHSPNPGFSTFEGPGLLIDLQRLNQINVSSDGKPRAGACVGYDGGVHMLSRFGDVECSIPFSTLR